MMRRSHKREQWSEKTGATILEVLVVLSIIALIAAVVGPRVIGYLGSAKSQTASLQVQNLASAVQLFYIDTARFPSESEGLTALVTSPPGDATWRGPYLSSEEGLTDPWGRRYLYTAPSDDGVFLITSLGRDGQVGGTGEDADITN